MEKTHCVCSGSSRERVLERREVEKRFLRLKGTAHGFRAFHASVRLLMESHSVPDGRGMPLHLLCARDLSALQGHDGIAAMVLDGDCGILCFHRGALGKCRHDCHF